MNWLALISSVPSILQLLSDPTFQAVVKAIEANFTKTVATGTSTTAASQQATGLLASAAMLHLTGNPVADFEAFVASLKPPVAVLPVAPKTGPFTS